MQQRLSQCCEISMGQAPNGEAYNFDRKGWPLIAGAGDFGDLYPDAKKFTTEASRLSNFGDIVLGIRATIGEKVIADGEYCLGRGVAGLRPKSSLDSRFLWHWLGHVKPVLASKAKGATFKQVNKEDIAELEISLPNLPEQRRIAAILDQADALRVKRREALAQLDSLTQSIFVEMFGDQSTNPKNWNIVPLGEVIDVLTDYHANGSYEILRNHVDLFDTPDYALMLRTTDLENNDFTTGVKYITEAAYNFLKKSQVFGGEIVINKIGSAGSVYLAPCLNRPVSLGMNSFLLRIAKRTNSRFIYDVLKSDYVTSIIRSKVRGAVTKTITKEAVRSIDIPLPPIEMQNEYVKRVDAITDQKRLHSKSLNELDCLFASLQHQAFRGEL